MLVIPATGATLRVALRCDASATAGVGHVSRCLALADELRAHDWEPVLIGHVSVPWLDDAIGERGLELIPAANEAAALTDQILAAGCAALVLDGYDLDPGLGHRARSAGVTVLTVQDGAFGSGQDADIVLDQNAGATATYAAAGSRALLGLPYALFRDEILKERRRASRPAGDPIRAVVFSGGTDPVNAVPVLVEILLEAGVAIEVRAVTASAEASTEVAGLERLPGQRVSIVAPTHRMASLAAQCDVALIAAGTSVWELLCIGVPCAVVAVADNQVPAIRAVNDAQTAIGLGSLGELRGAPETRADAVRRVRELLTDARLRAALTTRGQEMVDGHGRSRVFDALAQTVAARTRSPQGGSTPDGPPHHHDKEEP